MEYPDDKGNESIIISEAQLVLAEKRTSLALLRTGIAVLVLPLSAISFLIATSKQYDFFHQLYLLLPILILCFVLVLLGTYLIVRAVIRIHREDKALAELKRRHSESAKLLV